MKKKNNISEDGIDVEFQKMMLAKMGITTEAQLEEAYKNVHINIGPFVNPLPEDQSDLAWMFPEKK